MKVRIYVNDGGRIVKIEDAGTQDAINENKENYYRKYNNEHYQDDFLPNGGFYNYLGKTKDTYRDVDSISHATLCCDSTKEAVRKALEKIEKIRTLDLADGKTLKELNAYNKVKIKNGKLYITKGISKKAVFRFNAKKGSGTVNGKPAAVTVDGKHYDIAVKTEGENIVSVEMNKDIIEKFGTGEHRLAITVGKYKGEAGFSVSKAAKRDKKGKEDSSDGKIHKKKTDSKNMTKHKRPTDNHLPGTGDESDLRFYMGIVFLSLGTIFIMINRKKADRKR